MPFEAGARIHNLKNTLPGSRNLKRTGAAATAGALGMGAFAFWLGHGGGQVDRQATIEKAAIFSIQPETINCRARTSAAIESDASVMVRPKLPVVGHVDRLPVVGGIFRAGERTFRFEADFRGSDGQGGGQVDTISCAQAADMEVVDGPNGKQTITIPAKDVEFISLVVENQSTVVDSNGDAANVGTTEWDLTPFGEKRTIAVNVASLGSIAREAAVNASEQKCGDAAWAQTQQAFQTGERLVALDQYKEEVKTNPKLTFNPNNITVNIVGEPSFAPPYAIPEGFTVSDNVKGGCIVDSGAYVTPDYVTGAGLSVSPTP